MHENSLNHLNHSPHPQGASFTYPDFDPDPYSKWALMSAHQFPFGDSHFKPTCLFFHHHKDTSGSDTCRNFLFLLYTIALGHCGSTSAASTTKASQPIQSWPKSDQILCKCQLFTPVSVCAESHIPWGCLLFKGAPKAASKLERGSVKSWLIISPLCSGVTAVFKPG